MEGGTTFHFVTEGIEAASRAASTAAGDKDVRLGGGVATIREYLKAGLVDEMKPQCPKNKRGLQKRTIRLRLLFRGTHVDPITGTACT
jgi:hypothetical protein